METGTSRSTLVSVVGMMLVAGLFCFFYWTYEQFMLSYEGVQDSNQNYQKVLEDYVLLNREHTRELSEFKQRLQSTETLLDKVKEENDKLREKLVLMSKLGELEADIARLKERNNLILNQMSQMEWKSPQREKRLKTVAEAETLLVEYAAKLHLVKARLKDLKGEEQRKMIQMRADRDKMRMLMGNNGFLVRNGKSMPMTFAETGREKRKIDVTLVK